MLVNIDGQECKGNENQTIMDLARANGIFIPSLCYEEKLKPIGACSLCIVEIEGERRFVRACAMPIRNGMMVHTKTPRIISARKNILEMTISTHTGDCKAPCVSACPASSDCQGYISLIAEGRLHEAVRLMKEAHPFPASIARICPRPCEEKCRRQLVEEPVNIAGLKQFASDWDLANDTYIPNVAQHPIKNKNVAIIGGGPAGLTAAYFLRRIGFNVDVFEEMPKMGGLLRYGIPEYRLKKSVLDAELDILHKMGIVFHNNKRVGLSELQDDYDAVIIAIGAGASKPLRCKGENAKGVQGAIAFLKAVACGESHELGKHVVVIGGSNTAMDVARTSIRLGAEVTVAYRRTRGEMPADTIEIEEALAEGVKFMFLTAPLEVTEENGYVTGITLQKMALGEPDESGRRQPIPSNVKDSVEWIECNTIVVAVGQDVVKNGFEMLDGFNVDNNFRTELPQVYAIGDVTGKSSYAIDAISHGRKVANVVIADLQEKNIFACEYNDNQTPTWETLPDILVKDEKTSDDFDYVEKIPRLFPTPTTMEQAKQEASRCLSCGCAKYYDCKLIQLANNYEINPEVFPVEFHKKPNSTIDNRHSTICRDMNKCVLCGLCVRVCDNEAEAGILSAVGRGFETTISTAFGQALPKSCTSCGKCVSHCPVGALTFSGSLD